MNKLFRTAGLCFFLTTAAQAEAIKLELGEYLHQVVAEHKGIQGAHDISTGAALRSSEGSLILYPNLFSTIQLGTDEKPTSSTAFQGTKSSANLYSLGITQLTTFGLQAKLSYNLNYYDITGANRTFVPEPTYYDGKAQVELTQSIWRNGFGREVRAAQELFEAQALATSYAEKFKATVTIAEAETIYWRLALARETVAIQQETLARSVKILEWNQRRVNLQLADKVDLLQAEAALQARKLELQAAQDEERSAMTAFNTFRGRDSDVVVEGLTRPDPNFVSSLSVPPRDELRDDVKAAKEQTRVAISAAKVGREKALPNLDLFASYALNGRDTATGPTFSESFTTQFPTKAIGLRLSIPLGFGTISNVREGYGLEANAAEMIYERKRFEQDREWNDLVIRFKESKGRLELAETIQSAQRAKLMHERDRLNRGRTTTFQVLSFEQDYATAQLGFVRAETEVLRISAQLKTFGGGQ